ncbi:MAG: biotin/lipoyl-containing protein [Christensenellaceae bacterium]
MRKFIINVNGNSYDVEVEEVGVGAPVVMAPIVQPAAPVAAPAPAAPAAAPVAAPAAPIAAGDEQVTSPMPGTILRVDVTVGQSVKAGDILVILEAMKMENEIMAPCDGTIKTVGVAKGANVNTGDLLAVIG